MVAEFEIDRPQFIRRLKRIQSTIPGPLLSILGKKLEVKEFGHNSALYIYLLNYEFPETLLLITKDACYAVTSAKKKGILDSLHCDEMVVYERERDGSNDDVLKQELLKIADTVLLCDRNNVHGHFCDTYVGAFKTVDYDLGSIFREKEACEIAYVEGATRFAQYLMEEAIRMVMNRDVCIESKLEKLLDSPGRTFDLKLSQLEFSFGPRILRESNAVVISIGIRYMLYCTEIQRVLFYNEDDLEIYRLRNEKIGSGTFDNLKSIGLLQREGIRENEDGTFVMRTDHNNHMLIDVIKYENGRATLLTDDIARAGTDSTFRITDFLLEREKTSTDKKRLSRQRALEKEIEINEHQKELMDKLNDEMVKYYTDMESNEPEKEKQKRQVSYDKESQVPRRGRLVVDRRNFSVSVPIKGYMVPFHIETVKNCSLNGNDLRINFKESEVLKCVTYRSSNVASLLNEINDAKKEHMERREMSSVGEQGILSEIKGRRHVLGDVKIRTDIRTQKKSRPGSLELHENGFRFNEIVILFNNIEHTFYQQGGVYLLHFRLLVPIIFNGKKAFNVQFYKEVVENMSVDISRMYPAQKERLEEEQERVRDEMIKAEYDMFIKNIENSSNLRVDRVSMDVHFEGVPFRQNVMIRPSSTCLVYLLEPPFLIVDFDKMEVANFERVNYISRSFDLTFIFKDKTFITITSIDSRSMDYLKEFIDSRNICFIQTVQNINWPNLLRTIREDPHTFYNDGGWTALQPMRDDNDQEESSASTISSPSTMSDTLSDTDEEDRSNETEEPEDDSDIVDLNDIDSEYESDEDEHAKRKRW